MTPDLPQMTLLTTGFVVCRLEGNEAIPDWADNSKFCSITRTEDELSIVCPQENIPKDIPETVICEKDLKCLKVEGPLDFSLIGILANISTALAKVKISIFVVSTYNTDYILVKEENIEGAVKTLSDEGYIISSE